MTQIKDFTAAVEAADTDQLAIDNAAGQTRKVTLAQVKASFTLANIVAALGFTPRDAADDTVNTFNARTGAVELTSGDVTDALGFTPRDAADATVDDFTEIADLDAGTAADTDSFATVTSGGLARKLTLSQISSFVITALLGAARTFTDALTVNGTFTVSKTAQAGAAETLVEIKTTDAGTTTTGLVQIANATSTDSSFAPWWKSYAPSTSANLFYSYGATDSTTNPIQLYDARTAANGAIATRPLFAWNNNGSRIMTKWASGLMIGSGTATAAAAKLEVQDGSNSQIAWGTAADCAAVYASTTQAQYTFGARIVGGIGTARQTASAQYKQSTTGHFWYFNTGLTIGNSYTPTEIMQANGTGLGLNCTPSYRFESRDSQNQIAFGSAADQSFLSSNTTISRFAWGAKVNGGSVAATQASAAILLVGTSGGAPQFFFQTGSGLTPGSNFTPTNRLIISETLATLGVPAKNPSYTVATAPSASTLGAGAQAYFSNGRAGSPVLAVSNGTDWLRTDTYAAISAS